MQTDQRPSRAKRIVFRILATPFIIAFVLSALMVIFCLFNIDKEWWFGGLVGFVIIGAVTNPGTFTLLVAMARLMAIVSAFDSIVGVFFPVAI